MSSLQDRLGSVLSGAPLERALARMAVLPHYATDHERRVVAIGGPDEEFIAGIAALRTLRDPAKCPAKWLYLLAWDLSVDVWDPAWPESVKRAVIAASWDVHRFKGTPFAVCRALQAIGVTATLIPWYAQEPLGERGTFICAIDVPHEVPAGSALPTTARGQRNVMATVRRAKPLTRHPRFELRAEIIDARPHLGAAAVARVEDLRPLAVEVPAAAARTLGAVMVEAIRQVGCVEALSLRQRAGAVLVTTLHAA